MSLRILGYLSVSLVIAVSGCGYSLATNPNTGRNISIPVFSNSSLRPNLESCLTTALVERFAGSAGMAVVKPGQADLELSGAVLSYGETSSAFTSDDKVAMYQLSLSAESQLRQMSTAKLLWKGTVRAVQDYQTSSDLALKINAQDAALRELCRKLAESIVRESGSSF